MKLLILTQTVNRNDPALGFFHRWIDEFAKHFESIIVICLEEGAHELPKNVRVLSLGKEKKKSRLQYIHRFYRFIWNERKNYDSVFVHMNQEYVLLAGMLWKLLGKKIFLWRNHPAGSFLTDLASVFCDGVFCTSKFSFTAKYKKTEFMPVGVDLENFKSVDSVSRVPQSILFLGRITPVKRPDLLIDALIALRVKFPNITGSIYGNALPKDEQYFLELKEKVKKAHAENYITFYKGIPNAETVAVYSAHDIFVNLSPSGMYDKTMFEAMACGCLLLASNDNLWGQISDDFIFKQGDFGELTNKLEKLLKNTLVEKVDAVKELGSFTEKHSLKELGKRLFESIK